MGWWEPTRDPYREALRKARQLRLGDTVQVGDAVKVVGTVHADGPMLSAPLTSAGLCVLWEVEVQGAQGAWILVSLAD